MAHSSHICWRNENVEERQLSPACHRLNICVPFKIHSWTLIPNVMVSGGAALGRWLGHESGALMNRISALIEETPERSLAPCAIWTHGEKRASMSQEAGPHQTLSLPAPWSWTSSLQTVRHQLQLFISHPVSLVFCYVAQTKTHRLLDATSRIFPLQSWIHSHCRFYFSS